MNADSSRSGFLALWEENQLCDVELRTSDDVCIPAHRIVLAAVSPFFRAMFVGSGRTMREGGSSVIDLPGLDEASLRLLLRSIYQDKPDVTEDSVPSLLAAASYLSVGPVRDACCSFLKMHLSLPTAVDTALMADEYNCCELLEEAMRFLQSHFMPLLRSPDTAASLQPLTLPLLTDLLKSDELEVTTETDVLTSIALWLLGDLPQRAQHAGPLLATVRAFFAEAECRGAVFAASAALNPSPTLVEVDSVIRAMAAHAPDAALRNSPQWSLGISHRLGSPTQLMVAGGVGDGWRTQKGTELYDPRTDTWIAGPRMPVACNFAAACTLGRRTMVVEGAAHSPSVVAFDRHAKRWETLPRMQTARVNMAAAAVPEAAYVLGGRVGTGRAGVSLKTVEVYDEGAGVWKEVAEMTVPRASLAASALNGKIYAIGGQSDRQTHASLEYYDPGADVWCAAARTMARPRKYAGVGAVGGQLIIVGGMTAARARLPYAEAYDPREGLWRSLPGPMVRSSCGVAVLQGELYVAGGSVEGDQVYDGVDCFSLAAGAWRPCAPLSGGGRTGLALAPV